MTESENTKGRRWDEVVLGTLLVVQMPLICLLLWIFGVASMRLVTTIGVVLYIAELTWHIWADTRGRALQAKPAVPSAAIQRRNGEKRKSASRALVYSSVPE